MDGIWLEVRGGEGWARDMVCKIKDQWAGLYSLWASAIVQFSGSSHSHLMALSNRASHSVLAFCVFGPAGAGLAHLDLGNGMQWPAWAWQREIRTRIRNKLTNCVYWCIGWSSNLHMALWPFVTLSRRCFQVTFACSSHLRPSWNLAISFIWYIVMYTIFCGIFSVAQPFDWVVMLKL